MSSVTTHQTGDSEVQDAAQNGAAQEQDTASDAVDIRQHNTSRHQEDDILDGRRVQRDVASQASHGEDVHDVVHGDVASQQLLPHLNGGATHGALPHLTTEEAEEADVLALGGDGGCLPNVVVFGLDDWVGGIALSVQQRKRVEALLPALLAGEPTWGFGEEEQRAEEDEAGNALDTPRDAEAGRAVKERAAVGDKVHDQDTPFDGPLLNAHNAAADPCWCEFGQVDADLGRGDTDGETRDDTAGDEVTDVLSRALDGGTDNPDDGGDHEGATTAEAVRQEASREGTDEGSSGHGGGDTTLKVRVGRVKVVEVVLIVDPGAHGADIEAEERTTDGAESG